MISLATDATVKDDVCSDIYFSVLQNRIKYISENVQFEYGKLIEEHSKQILFQEYFDDEVVR